MKIVGFLLVLMAAVVGTWFVANSDRSGLDVWYERWAAGAIERVDDLMQRGAELRARLERMQAELEAVNSHVLARDGYWRAWVNGATAHVEELVEHGAELREEIALLRDDVLAGAAEIARLRDANTVLTNQVAGLELDNEALNRDLAVALARGRPQIVYVPYSPPSNRHPGAVVRHRKWHQCDDNIADYLNRQELLRHAMVF